MQSLRFIGAVSLVVGACSFAPDFNDTRYQCGVGDSCPSGYTCSAGVCVSQHPLGGDAGPDDPDGPPGVGTWRSDSADDFGAAGYVVTGATIDPRGAIEPVAYYTGGLLESGSAAAISDGVTATWDQVLALVASPHLAIARNTDVSWGSGAPSGVGLTVTDNWTLRFEGEVWLEAGDWTFFLAADDHGFLDMASPGGAFARVASSNYPNETSGKFHASNAAWYPIRWINSDASGNSSVRVRFQGPGVASASSIPHNRLRVRADAVRGLAEYGFDGPQFDGDRSTTIDATAPAAYDWGGGAPTDLGIESDDDFSERWVGQWRVEQPGTYYLRYVSDDGQRLWVDGQKVLDNWDQFSHERVSPPLDLAAGWHDLVIDHTEHVGSAKAMLTIDSGPELAGQPLPVDRLRPVEGRAERHEHGANHSDIAIPDAPSASVDGSADSTISFTLPSDYVTRNVEIGLTYDHEWKGDLRILLIAPSGKTSVLSDNVGNNGGHFVEHYIQTYASDEPVGGTWTVRFIDNDPGAVGTIRDVELTAHTPNAGEPPIATAASYVSPVHDMGAVTTIESVHWTARTPEGSTVAASVRTCASATSCDAAPWSTPMKASGAAPAGIAAGRFVQYKLDLTSDGDAVPSVERVDIDYATP